MIEILTLDELKEWHKDLTDSLSLLFEYWKIDKVQSAIFKITRVELTLAVKIKTEENIVENNNKMSFLRGFGSTKDISEFKEIVNFIGKHFYQISYNDGQLLELFDEYYNDLAQNVSQFLCGQLGDFHTHSDSAIIWETLSNNLFDETYLKKTEE